MGMSMGMGMGQGNMGDIFTAGNGKARQGKANTSGLKLGTFNQPFGHSLGLGHFLHLLNNSRLYRPNTTSPQHNHALSLQRKNECATINLFLSISC